MGKCFLSLLCLFFLQVSVAQNSITGNVVEDATGKTIANANVFITNSSKGTTTNADGVYILNDVPVGQFEVVISCIGFQTLTYQYTAKQLPLVLKVRLVLKPKEEATVTVLAYEKDGWQKWGKAFMDEYIGKTFNSTFCDLLNKDAVKFRYNKKTNVLQAIATEMLEIKNKKLGYVIKHQLEDFEVDFSARTVVNTGFPYFTPFNNKSKRKENKFENERDKAYKGSIMHLMRCLYSDSLDNSGFVIKDLQKIRNVEKDRVRAIIKKKAQNKQKFDVSSNSLDDTSRYYASVIKQPDYYDVIGKTYSIRDIVFRDSADKTIKYLIFPNLIQVEYLNEKQDEKYYSGLFSRTRTKYQTTQIFFVDDVEHILAIQDNGGFYPVTSIMLNGYMGWEKMADLLPLDYQVQQ
jgi:hypothetical protein